MATGYQGYSGAQGYDPERSKLDRSRRLAEMLQEGALDTGPKSMWEGVAQLGKAFIARGAMDRADKAESAYGDAQKQKYAQMADTISGMMYQDTPAISSGAKTTFAPTGEAQTTPGGIVTPQQQDPRAKALRLLVDQGMHPLEANQAVQSMAPKPVDPLIVNDRIVDPRTFQVLGDYSDPEKPVEPKAPETAMDGTMQWNAQTGKWEDIPGAMDRWRQLNPPKPEGSGGTLTPYQQFQIDRQTQADATKQEETDRQKQINIASLKDGMSRVDQFLGSKGFEGLYGTSWLGPVPTMGNAKPENVMNQDELNSMAMLNQIGGEAFLAGVAKMRGTGPLSDNEGKRVMAAVQRLTDRRQDKASAMAAANEFKAAMDALVKVYEQESGGAAMPGAVQTPQGQPNMLDAAGQFFGNMFGGGQRQGGQQPVRVNSKAERDALPPGTSYVAPDGSVKVKK